MNLQFHEKSSENFSFSPHLMASQRNLRGFSFLLIASPGLNADINSWFWQ
ncbi:hypothetical protein [Mucilaginibacter sp. UR6-11]|nr:hypothetical protein [Mucilaginibacter sp. UR6-11]